jgi:hypothetical protein
MDKPVETQAEKLEKANRALSEQVQRLLQTKHELCQTQEQVHARIHLLETRGEQQTRELAKANEYWDALHETTLGLIRRRDLNGLLSALVTRAGQLMPPPTASYTWLSPLPLRRTNAPIPLAMSRTGRSNSRSSAG